MAIPTLEDMTERLDEGTAMLVGDPLTYDGNTINGFIDHVEMNRGGIGAIEQDMSVQILRSDIPTRPGSANRITLPKLPGKTFKPVNVRLDDGATFWVFDLKEVPA